MTTEKSCFVIAPIGEEGSETRERSDIIFDEVIKEVVEDFGYSCTRADHIDEPGIITNQVITHIIESDLVIADLTDKNPNVFYELAVRHTHEKPVIQIINRNQEIPFDVATQRTIEIDLDDYSVTRRAIEQIGNQIEEIEDNEFEIENPVSVAGYIRELKRSDEPEKQQLAELTEVLNELNTKVRSIEKRVENPESLLPREYLSRNEHGMSADDLQTVAYQLGEIDDRLGEIYSEIGNETFGAENIKERIESIGSDVIELREWIRSQYRNQKI